MLGRIFTPRRIRTLLSTFSPGGKHIGRGSGTMELQQDRGLISLLSAPGVSPAGEMCRSCFHGKSFQGKTTRRDIRPPGKTLQGNTNFVRSVLEDYEQWEKQKYRMDKDVVHFTLKNKNIFVTVTDDKGNKKLGASAGCLKEIQGGSRRRTKYAVEATAEHVGRSARALGMKSVVVRVKGSSYFGKKKAAVLSFRKGLGSRSAITYIEDVTQLPHNGCRLPKRRRS